MGFHLSFLPLRTLFLPPRGRWALRFFASCFFLSQEPYNLKTPAVRNRHTTSLFFARIAQSFAQTFFLSNQKCHKIFAGWVVGCIFSRLFFLIELKIFLVVDINDKLSFPKFRENRSMSWIATLPSKFCNGHIKSKFQNYGRMVVDSLKRSS